MTPAKNDIEKGLITMDAAGTMRRDVVGTLRDRKLPHNFNLTDIQAQCIKAMCHVGNNKAIGAILNLTESEVKVHIRTSLRKLRIKDRTLLAVWAVRNGMDIGFQH
jgi:DNA-binding NarL/FixJ family response regulator